MSLSNLDLNLLLVLDTVLAERSVARAAARLHVTPSAVSNALARLRALFGDPLLARKGRGLVPTPRALELAPRLARALAELASAVFESAFDAATSTRAFTLALADVGQIVRLPAIAARFTRELPRARLRVVGIDALVSLGGLSGTEVDVVIGPAERGQGIHAEALFDETTTLVAREGHAASGRRLSKDALGALRHVAVEMVPGRVLRDLAAMAYARAGVARDVAMTVPSFTAAAAVVAATDLVATLPTSLVRVLGRRMGLRALKGAVPPHTVTMRMAWHDRTDGDPAMQAFRALIRRSVPSSNGPLS